MATGGEAEGDRLWFIENLTGSMFDDSLTGNHNDNILEGGGGNDVLIGGAGNDVLSGGDGADTFVIGANADLDHIRDFDVDNDTLDLSVFGLVEDSDLLEVAEQQDGYVLLSLAPNALVRLDGLELADLSMLNLKAGASEILTQDNSSEPESETLLEAFLMEDIQEASYADSLDAVMAL